jgi:hypothetical protein
VNPQLFKRIEAFNWYELNKNSIHHYFSSNYNRTLVDYPSFINGNGKVSRLIMNGILLQHGYLIAKLRLTKIHASYKILKASITKENKEDDTVL